MNKLSSHTVIALLIIVSAASLNAQTLQKIRVADNHRYFVQADGTPFFWLGDTAWSIFNQASPEQVALPGCSRVERMKIHPLPTFSPIRLSRSCHESK